MEKLITFLFVCFLAHSGLAQEQVPGILIAKVKPAAAESVSKLGADHPLIDELQIRPFINAVSREYPTAVYTPGRKSPNGHDFVDLTRTYRVLTNPSLDLSKGIDDLMSTGLFEFVETTSYSRSQYTPNDPRVIHQLHLPQFNVLAAWDSTLGDTNVVIGITDTGFDILHEDLYDNVKRNYADPIDGLDNDNDSYTDNFEGWDIFDNDNNLFFQGDFHGSTVSIVSSATPDNNIGAAGNGFYCKFLPVKVSNNSVSPNIITSDGHLGIQYAVEHGASVVNCSWGTTTWSQAGQDVVDYATINYDAVVVASAGNIEGYTAYYPASFANVISVTGLDTEDLFDNGVDDPFAHYDSIDVAALGQSVLTSATTGGPGVGEVYLGSGGTSLAAPQVSGVVGLIRSKFPCLTALEVMDLLIESADVIDTIPENVPYAGKIGKKLNALAAMQANLCTTVNVDERLISDLKIYPNPANDRLYWNGVPLNSETVLQVFNLLGSKVLETSVSNSFGSIDVSGLSPGIYEVAFIGKERTTYKLVVDR